MSTEPLVSVIIPTYNRASLVCRAIDNVLEQTWKNIELIVVDDGSTDDTLQRLRSYENRIRVVAQPNRGPAAARNRGLAVARGEIVAFQDSDDLWKQTKLEQQVRLLELLGPSVPCCLCNIDLGMIDGSKHTSFSYADMRPQNEAGLWTNVAKVLATRFVLFNQAVAVRRSILEKIGGFNEALDFLEDYDLALRLAQEGSWAFIRDPLVVYGDDGEGRSSHQALRDLSALKQRELDILGRTLAATRSIGDRQFEKLLTSRIRRLHRQRSAETLRLSNSVIPRMAAKVLYRANRLHEAFVRRSIWYPQMQTLQVEPHNFS